MRSLPSLAACTLLAALGAAQAAAGAPRHFEVLTAQEMQPELLLAPPPAAQSAQAAAELAELQAIARTTTPAAWAQAKWDNDHEDATIFQSAIGPGFDLARLPLTAKLLGEVRNEEAVAATLAKNRFKRTRPWIIDPSLRTCSRDEDPQSSFPSGHTTMAFAMAVVLAHVAPEWAPRLMDRARGYGQERMVCGMHFRSDVVAGEALGTSVAVLLLRDPGIDAQVAASRAELQAAHLLAAPS
ncbi:MAG TPA: phosphatase PAP2 family protein [Caulobacteraceae bacterium]|jgi:acid phosphatase (class A)